MNEQEFIETIEKATGLKAAKDFGFILGTQHPYGDLKPGFSNSGLINGYRVWKKTDTYSVEADFISHGAEQNLKDIVEFLQKKYVKSPTGELYLVGEFDEIPFG